MDIQQQTSGSSGRRFGMNARSLRLMWVPLVVMLIMGGLIWFLRPVARNGSQFGEIWQVYSFHPKVSATTYESKQGNATIIWVSGMDGDEDVPSRTSS
ncbi:MAG: hypothetical protein PHV34_19370 [Verrucomicrobiae bacterium]|nr:hypothetical protein [Verrucomicrobiae bacterium]